MHAGVSANLDTVVRVLDILIAIGRYVFAITVAFALLSMAAAFNSIATSNIIGVVFWMILTTVATIFAFQLVQTRRRRKVRRTETVRTEFPRAAQA